MKIIFRLLFFFVVISIPLRIPAEETIIKKYYLKRYDNSVGLSQNTVTCILQDSLGFMWFGTKDGLNKFDGHTFTVFRNKIGDDNSLKDNHITALLEGKANKLWIGSSNGLFIYDMELEKFTHFTKESLSTCFKIDKPVNSIIYDNKGILWISTQGQGLFSYDEGNDILVHHVIDNVVSPDSKVQNLSTDSRGYLWFTIENTGLFYSKDRLQTCSEFKHRELNDFLTKGVIHSMLIDSSNRLYMVSDQHGFVEVNIITQQARKLLDSNIEGTRVFMRKIIQKTATEFWVGTESGVFIVDINSLKYSHLTHELGNPYSLSDNAIHSLYKDREDNMWIGSYFGGVDYYSGQLALFEKYYPVPGQNGLTGERVGNFFESRNGTIWIGTGDGGLNMLSPQEKKITPVLKGVLHHNIHGIFDDEKYVWVGTFSKGFYKIDLADYSIVHHYTTEDRNCNLIYNNINVLYKDRDNLFWIGTGRGLQLLDEDTHNFITVDDLRGELVRDIAEDTAGNIYCATGVNGLFFFDKKKNTWSNYSCDRENMYSLPHNNVLSIFVDSKAQVWVTTQGGGFCRFDTESKKFIRYSTFNRLPNDVVYQILEDDNGLFWISTNEGLSHFNPETEEFFTYTLHDGLLSNQFNYNSSLRSKEGIFYFGLLNGFVSFNPKDMSKTSKSTNIVLTDFLLFNKKAIVNGLESPLKKSITFSDKVILHHKQNYFSLKFANLNYQGSTRNQYIYKLEGFDSEWLLTNENEYVYYPNLKHGKYTFKVRLFGNEGVDMISLPIEIFPPWWLSRYAFLFYSIVFSGFVYFVFKYISDKSRVKAKRQLEIYNREKEREIYTAKIDFFTNIAHEIRTPLALIKSPLDNIMQNNVLPDAIQEDLEIISKNTTRLQDLTNQLLDFRKIEKQKFQLTFETQNVTRILEETILRFKPLIKLNNLTLKTEFSSNAIFAYIDKEALTKIISNLLTNAIKNASTFIHIFLTDHSTAEGGCFDLTVENDGEVVPAQKREKLFKPFFQYKAKTSDIRNGTGLGLALARSLAELHQGYLVMNENDEVNSFHLSIPFIKENERKENERKAGDSDFNLDKRTILIVEDDRELLDYICKLLSRTYNVLKATDGKEAIEMLDKYVVNLVVTDIMMSNINGYELCRQIKTNIAYSHIPVVFLSAKNALSSKIEGLELGADTYIEKPFSNDFLVAAISNLLANRERLIDAFKKSPHILASATAALSKTDEAFMKAVYDVIDSNMGNIEFSQEDFASLLNMSKSSLYRKIKGLFDISPNDFIRINRVKKAAHLFEDGNDRVTEVCYIVGFNSPSYFSKCFHRQFGMTPTDYIESIKGTR
jgi:ligand-binding sensor domain-containing protein/signal transduction histidine kinase/DNA-binding response OmpR family regulator